MSENKYIIDKDSLTGIADAVRDKLGVGEATTDETTGDIIYPEDKGYYLKYIHPVQWTKGTITDTWSSTGTSYVRLSNITEEQLLRVCNGVRPVYVKIDVVLASASSDGISVENSLTSWSTSNHIVTLPTSGRFYCQYFYYHSTYYSGRYFQKTIPETTFSFLDENQEIIISENASDIVDDSYSTKNLPQESTSVPIPFSIDDIQDKITNYLGTGQEALQPTNAVKSIANAYSLDVTNIFSSTEDLLDRMQQVIAQNGSSAAYLRCGADGRPLSMKEQGISLPNGISSYNGGWNMNDVRAGYDNGLTFKFNFMASSFNQLNRWLWIFNNDNARRILVLCQDTSVGVPLNNSGTAICFYKEA